MALGTEYAVFDGSGYSFGGDMVVVVETEDVRIELKGLMALTLGGLRVVWTEWCRSMPFRCGTGVDTLFGMMDRVSDTVPFDDFDISWQLTLTRS